MFSIWPPCPPALVSDLIHFDTFGHLFPSDQEDLSMAPSTTTASSVTTSLPDRVRRQNHSCDHCRKSKKACDGYMINEAASRSAEATSFVVLSGNASLEPLPCSYCVRTKKACSKNPYWSRRLLQHENESPATASEADWHRDADPKRQRTGAGSSDDLSSPDNLEHMSDEERAHAFQLADLNSLPWGLPMSGPDAAELQSQFHLALPPLYLNAPFPEHDESFGLQPQEISIDHMGQLPPPDAFLCPAQPGYTHHDASEYDSQTSPSSIGQGPMATPLSNPSSRALVMSGGGGRKKRRVSEYSDDGVGYQPSISTADSLIMLDSNNLTITDSLLRIYHDVLENNLACWLAEENCPYKMVRLSGDASGASCMAFPAQDDLVPPEWGMSWSNRLYSRVAQLDRAAQRAKTVRLTRSESQAASRALNLVIMAFATQYAQGSRRRERFRSVTVGSDELRDSFEETLQQNIWRQAKQALSEVSDLESYRVVYAELIFGLTEKPWLEEDLLEEETVEHGSDIHASALSKILDAVAHSGPPVYLDRAAKKIQTLRCRFEANETAATLKGRTRTESNIAMEDRKTIGLLYWLAVMFDTVSSSMNERPVALADEECEQDVVQEKRTSQGLEAAQRQSKWEVEIFVPRDPSRQLPRLSWPCSYEIATTAISRSAPIKILIFRHLSYLQNILRRKEFGQPMDEAIRGATMVYRYWNTTYGSFYRDLVQYYDSVPTRIRSWFVCIYIPWHLASIMLSEIIDLVDNSGLGCETGSDARRASNMASRMRKSSAVALSDLARVTTPEVLDDSTQQQLPGYHFAVEEGPLMTEPWTVILVRAFTKTALFHLDEAEDLRQHDLEVLGQRSEELQDSMRRAEDCARALWSLGKKSQAARNISNILSAALERM